MQFWRVVNWLLTAAQPEDNGHPLFVWPKQGVGRIDDPDRDYLVLYVGDTQEGAAAEAFGRFATWTPDILDVPVGAPAATVKALAKYEGNPAILDLDDPYVLHDWSLRPSQVVMRDTASTQRWAREMYDAGDYAGLSWWSFYAAQWSSIGLWDRDGLSLIGAPVELTLDHDAIQEAADTIKRVITGRRVRV